MLAQEGLIRAAEPTVPGAPPGRGPVQVSDGKAGGTGRRRPALGDGPRAPRVRHAGARPRRVGPPLVPGRGGAHASRQPAGVVGAAARPGDGSCFRRTRPSRSTADASTRRLRRPRSRRSTLGRAVLANAAGSLRGRPVPIWNQAAEPFREALALAARVAGGAGEAGAGARPARPPQGGGRDAAPRPGRDGPTCRSSTGAACFSAPRSRRSAATPTREPPTSARGRCGPAPRLRASRSASWLAGLATARGRSPSFARC